MPLLLDCPGCQRKLRVPDHLLGKTVKCPTCGEMFTATGESVSPETPPPLGAAYDPPPAQSPRGAEPSPSPQRPRDRDEETPSPRRRSDTYEEDDDDPYYGEGRYRRRMDLKPHRGTTVLVLGILSLVVCGLLGPVAWILGQSDLREMRQGIMDRSGQDTTNAGRICGIIATALLAIGLGSCVFFMLLGAVGAARF